MKDFFARFFLSRTRTPHRRARPQPGDRRMPPRLELLEKKVFLIVDNLSVHDAKAVNEWLAGQEDKIEVFYLPKYAPELNPDEYLNCDVKVNINADGLPKDREELQGKLQRFMEKLRTLPGRIASYFRHKFLHYAAAPRPTAA